MSSFRPQIKRRRVALGLKQQDMEMRVGMSRQQYQRLEAKGNPRLDTLELLARGLKSELLLIPQDKMLAVTALLEGRDPTLVPGADSSKRVRLSDDPWHGLLALDDGEED